MDNVIEYTPVSIPGITYWLPQMCLPFTPLDQTPLPICHAEPSSLFLTPPYYRSLQSPANILNPSYPSAGLAKDWELDLRRIDRTLTQYGSIVDELKSSSQVFQDCIDKRIARLDTELKLRSRSSDNILKNQVELQSGHFLKTTSDQHSALANIRDRCADLSQLYAALVQRVDPLLPCAEATFTKIDLHSQLIQDMRADYNTLLLRVSTLEEAANISPATTNKRRRGGDSSSS